MIKEGRVFGVTRELYKEGEDIMDVLRRVKARDNKIPRYHPPPSYDNEYIPNHQASDVSHEQISLRNKNKRKECER